MKRKLNSQVVDTLNRILEMELAGAVHYTHYSFMVYGYNRIPIVKWLEEQATESMSHARTAGEMVTLLGAHPSLAIGPLLETHKHSVDDILGEALEHEQKGLDAYRKLLEQVRDRSIMLEEFAREMIAAEEMHTAETRKMMRRS